MDARMVQFGYGGYPQIVGPDAAYMRDYAHVSGGPGSYAVIGASDQELQAELQRRMVNTSVMVRDQNPMRAREYPLGFDSGAALIAAGATAQVVQQPQILFRSERLVVPSDVAGSFLITELLCGKDNMFAAAGAVHARTFDERGVGVRLSLATSQVSQQIVIRVQNIGGAPARFFATMIGTAIE